MSTNDVKLSAIKMIMNEDWFAGNIGERIHRINKVLEDDVSDNPLEDVRKIVDEFQRGKSVEGIAIEKIRRVVSTDPAPMTDQDRINYWWRKCKHKESILQNVVNLTDSSEGYVLMAELREALDV